MVIRALVRVDAFMAKNGDVLARAGDGVNDAAEDAGVAALTDTCVDFYRARATFVNAMRALREDAAAGAREAKIAADALVAALAPRASPPELWPALIIDAAPLFESSFDACELFSPDAVRLLAARAHGASALGVADSARALDALAHRARRPRIHRRLSRPSRAAQTRAARASHPHRQPLHMPYYTHIPPFTILTYHITLYT
jgi:nuclear pore complex protein Nup85